MTGFQSWTKYEQSIVKLRQFYDFTHHLYNEEVDHLRQLLREKKQTIHTSLRLVSHSVNSLYQYTKSKYPQNLREMVLVQLISTTEIYLIRLIKEIYSRDKALFAASDLVEISKNELFNAESINIITDRILGQELRSLTSGGILQMQKYYLKKFGIDFNELTPDLSKIMEYFDRRHLFIHANGIVDKAYFIKYSTGKIGERIVIEHEYIDNGLVLFKNFGLILKEKAIEVCPYSKRLTFQTPGGCQIPESNIYYAEIICRKPMETMGKIKSISINGVPISTYIIKYIITDNSNLKIFFHIFDKNGFKALQTIKKAENTNLITFSRIT